MSLSVSQLLEGSGARPKRGLGAVFGLRSDSRNIEPGDIFFALPGGKIHGNDFIDEAVRRGALAVITDMHPVGDPGVPVIVVTDVRAAYARAASRIFEPQPEINVAVTGTNGKTSVASFVRQIWTYSGIAGASIGTLGVDTETRHIDGSLTTPDARNLHQSMRALKAQGIDHVALEASSHGLEQRRLDGIHFEAVAFTNLSRDHLDYHEDMDAYRNAKLRLFTDLLVNGGPAVVNVDDPEYEPFMFAALGNGSTLLTVGREGAYIEILSIETEGYGQRVEVRHVGEKLSFHLPLTGEFQVSNALIAAALAMSSGADKEHAFPALSELKGAKGRLELVAEHKGAAIFIDYSHTPDALKTALNALRPYAKGSLRVVFGCGGDRDKGKRPQMGAIASELADSVIVTDDNPRTEDAATIRKEIMAAAKGAKEIGDRKDAIVTAIKALKAGDVLLIAGKGHEEYQIVGTTKHHFSDHEVVAEAIKG
ncbi:MAG: UDP-N-acetylmuramoyl-L-alanyl-D-glutamate--2,6-diaminopimelate ligase [Devosia sp.]|uniref:UDP-N-acetylmuramoyl-L-alanyl-D-glutamate--2, 6-diaminopimelate ligase n=1 Tax=Devosia sp. TaxID=1871048 RepID=UPI0026259717|nr:UDP-N-acetylmuramoyl-L-alanyl-D-glutamate--2,6-diaminopimelate ligase [Devosia sp.]MDB5537314.1 UDP-N-acetylmuramoyl-L-alanyl-D-glutamate--2,6-diaminopimelate ligase [Devosia sp.]MDB5585428.1 UDP-N-acetylmuramoyl-L-alanyl-D-glutamate--2,6-diaminopimelate ligase [Devosia sp.]